MVTRELPVESHCDLQLSSNMEPGSSIRSISWNPLGNLIATGSNDRTIRVCKSRPHNPVPYYGRLCSVPELTWRAGNPEKPHVRFSTELKGHNAVIEKVAFNPVKDAELCSVSNDGVVKFWDVRTKACVNEVKDLGAAFTLAWAPDGESLVVGNKVHTPVGISFF